MLIQTYMNKFTFTIFNGKLNTTQTLHTMYTASLFTLYSNQDLDHS